MKFKLLVLFLLSLILYCEAGESGEQDRNVITRFARDTGFIRFKRQSTRVCEDGNNTLCLPEGVTSAPMELVDCIEGQCVCQDCFMINDSTGQCRICSEYSYRNGSNSCGLDNRPSQLTAFLLSLFLSSTGAANFYIGRNDIGGGQLFLLILILSMSYSMCCLPICLACCLAKDEVKGNNHFLSSVHCYGKPQVLQSTKRQCQAPSPRQKLWTE